jgi:hypothetical protein
MFKACPGGRSKKSGVIPDARRASAPAAELENRFKERTMRLVANWMLLRRKNAEAGSG